VSWPVVELGSVVSFIGGSQPPKAKFKFKLEKGYVRLLQIRDYKSDDNLTYIPKNSTKKFCTKDDVMIGRYGPPVFQILRGLDGAYNVALMKASPDKSVDNDYLYYFLKQEKLFRLIDGLSQRTAGQSGVDMNALKTFPMLLPPLEEQKRIAAILDKADAIRRKRQQAIQLADDFLRATFLDMFGDPVTNPKGWEISCLNDISIKKGEYGSGKPAKEFCSGDYRYVRITDINSDGSLNDEKVSLENAIEEAEKYILHEGDLLFARTGATVGKTFLYSSEYGKCVFAGYLIRFKINQDLALPEYVKAFCDTNIYWNWVKGCQKVVAQPNINAKQYGEDLRFPLPPKKMQEKFVKIWAKVNKLKSSVVNPDDIELFYSLSQKAFSGQL
jgi:type I restriction enzyme S subunit